ncbi:helix-turn-helix transcriptional regulator [Ruegeria atlantica]|uniref:helix-turn-helix transcriptional regulator n=1 Tax=Ruegeria atlantica TaxID=81569 RepID=UPI001479CFB9|nr:helix-turn-helix domain-containing protein [Ruegeria atlantica]
MSDDRICALESRLNELETKLSLPHCMTTRQVCEFVGISEVQFYEWKKQGDVPPAMYWSARTVRYDREDVMAWAKAHKVGGAG